MTGIETYGSQVQGLLVTLSIILDAALSIDLLKDSMRLPKCLASFASKERSFPIWPSYRLKLGRGLVPYIFRLHPGWARRHTSQRIILLYAGALTEVAAFASAEAGEWEAVWVVRLVYMIVGVRSTLAYVREAVRRLGGNAEGRGDDDLERIDILKKRWLSGVISTIIGLLLFVLATLLCFLVLNPSSPPLSKVFYKLQGRGLVDESLLVSTLVVKMIYVLLILSFLSCLNEVLFFCIRIILPTHRELLRAQWRGFLELPPSCTVIRTDQLRTDNIRPDNSIQISVGEMEEQRTTEQDNCSLPESEARKDRRMNHRLIMRLRYDMLMIIEELALLIPTILSYRAAAARAASEARRISYIWLLYISIFTLIVPSLFERFIYGYRLREEIVDEEEKQQAQQQTE